MAWQEFQFGWLCSCYLTINPENLHPLSTSLSYALQRVALIVRKQQQVSIIGRFCSVESGVGLYSIVIFHVFVAMELKQYSASLAAPVIEGTIDRLWWCSLLDLWKCAAVTLYKQLWVINDIAIDCKECNIDALFVVIVWRCKFIKIKYVIYW